LVDTNTNKQVFIASIVAYAFSPIDLIPDFIPVLGYLDALVIIPLAVTLALKMIPQYILDQSREKADALQGKPKTGSLLLYLSQSGFH